MSQEDPAENGLSAEDTGADSKKPKKNQPTKTLPPTRISFDKQAELLRAWAIASGPERKPVKNGDAANIVQMHENTVSLANPFFISMGFLQKADGGLIPSLEVCEFARAYQWDAETAPEKLANVFAESWFGQALLPRLSFRPLDTDAAIGVLADACAATPEYKGAISLLIDYLDLCGVLQKEGNVLKPKHIPHKLPSAVGGDGTGQGTAIKTPSPSQPQIQNKIEFQITFSVDMTEISKWEPARIASFFGGIAQVMAAKSGVEKAVT